MYFKKTSFQKKNQGKYIVGYELGPSHVQMSYLKIGETQPCTLSLSAEEEQYNIPFVLYRREDKNLWYIGEEAYALQAEFGGPLLENLLTLAYEDKYIEVYPDSYDAADLLALFVKRSLSYLTRVVPLEQTAAIMFAVEALDETMVSVLRKMVDSLQLPGIMVQFMSKEESFYYYNLHTDSSLWANQVFLYEMQENVLQSYRLSLNRQTKPVVTLIEHKEYPLFPGKIPETEEEKESWDAYFLKLLKEDMEGRIVSTVYLIGEGFLGEWYQHSVRFLCTKRRVFLGNNLYSKGACHGLWDKLEPGELSASYVYLGTDKLPANVGMELSRQGAPSYLAILDGGQSWYDCRKNWDMILEEDNRIVLKITPLTGKNITYAEIVLQGLTPAPLCRIRAEVYMETSQIMKVKLWEQGFGEFYPSAGGYWEESIKL